MLILGGSGGVGSMAVQLASKVLGAAAVATTCSTKNIEFVQRYEGHLYGRRKVACPPRLLVS